VSSVRQFDVVTGAFGYTGKYIAEALPMNFGVMILDAPKKGSYATLDSVVVGGGCDAVCDSRS
jgi:short subunit dehydrogenase-like uncharacterized protein